MSKVTTVAQRRYTDEFKREAVRLAAAVGGTESARRLGNADSSLGNWIRPSRAGKLSTGKSSTVAVQQPQTELEAETPV